RPRSRGRPCSRAHSPFELVLDVDADDLVEARLRLEAQLPGTLRLEVPGPAADDAEQRLVGLSSDERDRLLAGDPAQCRDLLGDRDGDAGHRQTAAVTERGSVERRSMEQEADRSAR